MRIVLTMNLPFNRADGGANKSNRILVQELAKSNHEVIAVTPALAVPNDITHEELLEGLASNGISVEIEPTKYRFTVKGVEVYAIKEPEHLASSLERTIKEFRPDWIFVSTEDPSQSLLKTALKPNLNNVIYLCHTHYMLPFGRLSLYPGKVRTQLIKKVRAVLVISNYMSNYLKESIELDSFVYHPPHYEYHRSKRVGRFENKYILMINPCTVKGIEILLGLAKELKHRNFAVVPGWGTTPSDIEKMEACGNITLFQRTKDLNALFGNVSLLLMPSVWEEGFGMSVIDALCRGVPVISSKSGGIPEAKLGTNYQIGLHPISSFKNELDENSFPIPEVPKQDILPWRKAVESLLTDETLYEAEANLSFNKAKEFVSNLKVEPLVDFLSSLKSKTAENSDFESLDANQKRALINKLRNQKKVELFNTFQITPVQKQEHYDVSFSQQQRLLMDEMTKDHVGSMLGRVFFLPIILDLNLIQQTMDSLVERHESLRTQFLKVDGVYKQKILSPEEINFVVDVADLRSDHDKLTKCKSYLDSVMNSSFDLKEAPLFRLKLLRLEDSQTLVVLAMHHIVGDGVSMRNFFQDFQITYQNLIGKTPFPLKKLEIQYKDFTYWQKKFLKSKHAESMKLFWHERLSQDTPVIQLPYDFKRPPIKSFAGKSKQIFLNEEIFKGIDAICKKFDTSFYITLLTFVKILLHKYSNQDEIVIGSATSGRNSDALKNQIGYYVNMIAIKSNINSSNSFSDQIVLVRNNSLEAYSNDLYPFELLVDELVENRDMSRSPIFDVMVAMNLDSESTDSNVDKNENDFVGTLSESLDIGSSHDVAFNFHKSTNSIWLNIIYSTSLFKEESVDRMGAHFLRIINQVIDDSEISIKNIKLLNDAELGVIKASKEVKELSSSNEQEIIIQKFENIVEKFPKRRACSYGGHVVTYKELNAKANQLGHLLRKKGVQPNDIVTSVFPKSIDAVVSILGILKSGGSYLCIDPTLPLERIEFIIRNCNSKFTIIDERLLGQSEQLEFDNFIHFNEGTLAEEIKDDLSHVNKSEDNCYVIYTSGSTGNPKGVVVTNKNLNSLFVNLPPSADFSQEDKWPLFHSLSFDFSVWELFGALLHGAELVILPEDLAKDPSLVLDAIIENQITILNQVPGAFYGLQEIVLQRELTNLPIRKIFFGGDELHPIRLKPWKEKYPAIQLINMYGITETTIHVTHKLITLEDINRNINNIGISLNNSSVWILDRDKNILPKGFVGELYISGHGLAKGYLNLPELTKERFIDAPFSPNLRLYRTGDSGKILDNNEIELHGRIDNQVQIRGFRVELDEINRQLLSHPNVYSSVVSHVTDTQGQKEIVAYFVAIDSSKVDLKPELYKHVGRFLPSYMVPTYFVKVDEIPLSSNGKIDVKSLPSPHESIHGKKKTPYPVTETEKKLFKIWSAVLDHENFGIDHNFFEVGGHSLKAAKVSSMIYKEFEIDISLGDFFDKPSIKDLAEYVDVIFVDNDLEESKTQIII